jgi:hypothetical protein
MAAVTKNRNFFNCPLLLYYKSKLAVSSFTFNPSFSVEFFRSLILKQQWKIEEISIFSNSSHLEWKAGLSDTILKGTIPARFVLI